MASPHGIVPTNTVVGELDLGSTPVPQLRRTPATTIIPMALVFIRPSSRTKNKTFIRMKSDPTVALAWPRALRSHHSSLITHYSLLITHYSLLITHYSSLITHHSSL